MHTVTLWKVIIPTAVCRAVERLDCKSVRKPTSRHATDADTAIGLIQLRHGVPYQRRWSTVIGWTRETSSTSSTTVDRKCRNKKNITNRRKTTDMKMTVWQTEQRNMKRRGRQSVGVTNKKVIGYHAALCGRVKVSVGRTNVTFLIAIPATLYDRLHDRKSHPPGQHRENEIRIRSLFG